jgi:hypothetical protein
MDTSQKILSDITVFLKYAKYNPELNRREVWTELVDRNKAMHLKKYPQLADEIETTYKFVYDKKILPSMRSMQFAGKPIEISPNRIYNCAFAPVDDWRTFGEIMFLLLGGTGIGFSVQKHHVEKLPEIRKPNPAKFRRYLISDSIEGWADAVKALMKSHFQGGSTLRFDYSDIRPKGAALITSGGKAPGPQPLRECLVKVQGILDRKEDGDKLEPIEVHDIVCHIADAVLAGGIRRAALISLFSADDEEMISCKSGNWWELNPQRGRANNSATLLRRKVTKEYFLDLWNRVKASGAGEPGIYFTNDKAWGTNPSLRAGTKVITETGIYNIEDLQDKSFKVKNLNGTLSEAKCWMSGKDKQLYEITLAGGKKYYATPEHEWPVWNGMGYSKVKTEDLTQGQYFPVIKQDQLFEGKQGSRSDGFLLGWNIGDGWVVNNKEKRNNIGFIFSQEDILHGISDLVLSKINEETGAEIKGTLNNSNCLEYTTNSKYLNNLFEQFKYTNKKEGLPEAVWKEGSEDFRKGLIDGLYSSDGGVENPKHGRAVNYYTVHKKLAEDLSELLGFYGIKNSVRKHTRDAVAFGREYKDHVSYVVSITERESILHFAKLFTLSHKHKQSKLQQITAKLLSSRYATRKDSDKIKIADVKLSNIVEDVWDISVYDEDHCFQISHCITGNCCEIALRPYQFCNLCEVNVSNVGSQEELNERVKAAAFLGTLQAGYTDFHYLREVWRRTTEKDALIGVSMTGIGSGAVLKLNTTEAAEVANQENIRVAELIGINKAARVTTVKPAGCQIPSTVIRTDRGELSLHDIFKLNEVNLENHLDDYREWFPVTTDIKVYDENGEENKITKLFVNGFEETVKFTMEDGSIVECTPNHKFMMKDGSWKQAIDITEEDEWAVV